MLLEAIYEQDFLDCSVHGYRLGSRRRVMRAAKTWIISIVYGLGVAEPDRR
jgi:hypothetical protein